MKKFKPRSDDDFIKKLMTRKEKKKKKEKHAKGISHKYYPKNESLVDKYLGESRTSAQGLAKEIKRKHKKTVSIDDLMTYMAQSGLHPDDDMPDVEDALNSMGVKVMPTWSNKNTKVGDMKDRRNKYMHKSGRDDSPTNLVPKRGGAKFVKRDPKSWGGAMAKKHGRK